MGEGDRCEAAVEWVILPNIWNASRFTPSVSPLLGDPPSPSRGRTHSCPAEIKLYEPGPD